MAAGLATFAPLAFAAAAACHISDMLIDLVEAVAGGGAAAGGGASGSTYSGIGLLKGASLRAPRFNAAFIMRV